MVIYGWPKWSYIVIVHTRNFEQEICLSLLKKLLLCLRGWAIGTWWYSVNAQILDA